MPPMSWGTPGRLPGLTAGAMQDRRAQTPHHEVLGVCYWGGVGGNSKREAIGNHHWMAELWPQGSAGWAAAITGVWCTQVTLLPGRSHDKFQPTCNKLSHFLTWQGSLSLRVLCLPCRIYLGPSGPWQHKTKHFWSCATWLPHQCVHEPHPSTALGSLGTCDNLLQPL